MSAIVTPDLSQTSSSGPKKKNNKKKKNANARNNGNTPKDQDLLLVNGDGDGDVDDSDGVSTPKEAQSQDSLQLNGNGNHIELPSNGHKGALSPPGTKPKSRAFEDRGERDAPEKADTSSRFEAMSQEREALRAEVEQLRKSLEDIQEKHTSEVSTIQTRHAGEISSLRESHSEEITTLKDELTTKLGEAIAAKEHSERKHMDLVERVNTIRTSLGERLKADRQELDEAKEQIEELETHNSTLQKRVENLESDVNRLEAESKESSRELSSLRNRHNLSQQNWVHEREDFIQQNAHLKDEADAAKEAMGDWEVLAMEERSMREGLTERIADIEEQFNSQREAYELVVSERDSQSQIVDGLQRALQEVQEARKLELREMVETYEEQLQSLKKLVQDSDVRASEAEAAKGGLQTELERLGPFEKEVKEKNLLIGKLRHEAIVLNDHLTKALRFLKKAKPEDNVDRQIVTNHFLHFLALDRSDPKKFQILQLIAALLNWTDEQKEQAGLARPGASNSSLRLPISPFHRTPSTPSLSSELFTESSHKESLADLWTGFLERSAEEGSTSGSRSGSVSSAAPQRPETRGGDSARG